MTDCAWTGRYEVAKKKSKVKEAVEEMAQRIKRDFAPGGRVACGIVYCLSRNDCEKVAAELQVSFPSPAPEPAHCSLAGQDQLPSCMLRCRASGCAHVPVRVSSSATKLQSRLHAVGLHAFPPMATWLQKHSQLLWML